jgi:tRNA threonylcarbamoyl adenosine modification protein (Sua5/YciO/YrdC/YwlC family)
MIVEIHKETPSKHHISLGVKALKKGELIIYPTDTLYGLGCDIHNKSAIDEIYLLKKMNKKKPLSFICYDFKQVSEYANVSNFAYKTMRYLTPGPYTFILPATNKVPKLLKTKQKTVGIRIPDCLFARELVSEFGSPILSTSISNSENQYYSDPLEINDIYRNRISLVFSMGITYSQPSTIIDLRNDKIEILREGKAVENVL